MTNEVINNIIKVSFIIFVKGAESKNIKLLRMELRYEKEEEIHKKILGDLRKVLGTLGWEKLERRKKALGLKDSVSLFRSQCSGGP